MTFFDDEKNLSRQKLFHILMTYSIYHPVPGYVQGNLFGEIEFNTWTYVTFV